MVKTKTAGILAIASVSVWGLTACGGGGGGSSSSIDDTPTQFPSDADIELDPDGYASQRAVINTKGDTTAILGVYGDAEQTYLLGEDIDNAVMELPRPTISGNKFTYKCENSGNVVITVNSDDVSDDERWRFTNCKLATENFGEIVLNGDYDYVNKVVNGGQEGGQRFDLSGKDSGGDAIVVKGLDKWNINGDNEKYTTAALEFKVGTEYFAVENAETTFDILESRIEITLTARLIGSSINGYIDISTPTAVIIANDESCPESGVVRLDGANDTYAEILYGMSSGSSSVAVVETNSSEVEHYDNCDSLIFDR